MLWVPKEMPQIQLRKCRWRFLDQWIFLLHIFIGQSFLLKSKFCMLQLIRFGPNRRLLLHRPYWQFILPFSKTNTVPLLPIKCLPWKRINKFLLLSGGKDFCSISINHDSLFHRKRKHGGGKDSSFVAFGDFLHRSLYQLLLFRHSNRFLWRFLDCFLDRNRNGSSWIQRNATQKLKYVRN